MNTDLAPQDELLAAEELLEDEAGQSELWLEKEEDIAYVEHIIMARQGY